MFLPARQLELKIGECFDDSTFAQKKKVTDLIVSYPIALPSAFEITDRLCDYLLEFTCYTPPLASSARRAMKGPI